jgi:hypothetical protein
MKNTTSKKIFKPARPECFCESKNVSKDSGFFLCKNMFLSLNPFDTFSRFFTKNSKTLRASGTINCFLLVIVLTMQPITASSVVVRKEKISSAAALNQEASAQIGEILQTSAKLVKDIGTLQTSCLDSLKRVVEGEGEVTKTKLSSAELKKCVDTLKSYNAFLQKLEQEVSDCCAFCSAKL